MKTIFIESDDNNDGVLTLDEFWVLMKKMQGREKAEEAFLDQGEKPVVVGINTAQAREREKLRNVALFNQALDLSIDQYK